MTNEEASNVLRIMATGIKLNGYTEHWLSSFKEAYEMAIKVLDERPQGEWEFVRPWHLDCNVSVYKCSVCGRTHIASKGQIVHELYPFCNCGAEMKGSDKE